MTSRKRRDGAPPPASSALYREPYFAFGDRLLIRRDRERGQLHVRVRAGRHVAAYRRVRLRMRFASLATLVPSLHQGYGPAMWVVSAPLLEIVEHLFRVRQADIAACLRVLDATNFRDTPAAAALRNTLTTAVALAEDEP